MSTHGSETFSPAVLGKASGWIITLINGAFPVGRFPDSEPLRGSVNEREFSNKNKQKNLPHQTKRGHASWGILPPQVETVISGKPLMSLITRISRWTYNRPVAKSLPSLCHLLTQFFIWYKWFWIVIISLSGFITPFVVTPSWMSFNND